MHCILSGRGGATATPQSHRSKYKNVLVFLCPPSFICLHLSCVFTCPTSVRNCNQPSGTDFTSHANINQDSSQWFSCKLPPRQLSSPSLLDPPTRLYFHFKDSSCCQLACTITETSHAEEQVFPHLVGLYFTRSSTSNIILKSCLGRELAK